MEDVVDFLDNWLFTAFKGTLVNQALSTLYGHKILCVLLTVPLIVFKFLITALKLIFYFIVQKIK